MIYIYNCYIIIIFSEDQRTSQKYDGGFYVKQRTDWTVERLHTRRTFTTFREMGRKVVEGLGLKIHLRVVKIEKHLCIYLLPYINKNPNFTWIVFRELTDIKNYFSFNFHAVVKSYEHKSEKVSF